jgi:hypothetical protein
MIEVPQPPQQQRSYSSLRHILPHRYIAVLLFAALVLWGCLIPSSIQLRAGQFGLDDVLSGMFAVALYACGFVLLKLLIWIANKGYWTCGTIVAVVMLIVGVLALFAPAIAPQAFAPLDAFRAFGAELERIGKEIGTVTITLPG